MTSLPLPKRMTLDENGEFVIHSDSLPSIINPAEARLGMADFFGMYHHIYFYNSIVSSFF